MQPRVLTRRAPPCAGRTRCSSIGTSSRDPDLLPFTGEARLDHCFVVARPDGARWLGFHSPIEREEAAIERPAAARPGDAARGRAAGGGDRPGARLARSVGIALRAAKIRGRRIALGGRYPNGELTLALAGLRRQGFSFVSGHDALLRLRRPKAAAELAEMRAVAAGHRGRDAPRGARARRVGARARRRAPALRPGGRDEAAAAPRSDRAALARRAAHRRRAASRGRDHLGRRRARGARRQPDRSRTRGSGAAQHRQSRLGAARS